MTRVDVDELVTGADIARKFGISRERVSQLAKRDDFPESLGKVGVAIMWRWADIEAWAKRTGREIP